MDVHRIVENIIMANISWILNYGIDIILFDLHNSPVKKVLIIIFIWQMRKLQHGDVI